MKIHQNLQRNLRPHNIRQRGISLIETMVAIVISAIGITGFSSALINAHQLGNSAQQSSVITMARSSVFSYLRLNFSNSSLLPVNYQFRSNDQVTFVSSTSLDNEMQQLIDELSFSLSNIQSTIDCETSNIATCEVCFEWYDHAQSGAMHQQDYRASGATNRSTCQIQIV